jgi:hypothetical protein
MKLALWVIALLLLLLLLVFVQAAGLLRSARRLGRTRTGTCLNPSALP